MARAKAYDEYEDAGLAFSVEELALYRPQKWAEQRVLELREMILVLKRRELLPEMPKPEWWKGVRKRCEQLASWYCVALEVPALAEDDVALPPPTSHAGKRLAKSAAGVVDGQVWLDEARVSSEASLKYVVTLGRRCQGNPSTSGWKLAEGKQSNKLANCIVKELYALDRLQSQLDARKS